MIKRFLWFSVAIILFTACKKEISEVGSDLTNPSFYRFKVYTAPNLKFYSHSLDRVKSQGQPLIGIGVYKHPVYGITEADLKITFNNSKAFSSENFLNADSILFVQLRIPFFSKKDEVLSTDDTPVYKVDSVFGSGPIKLEVFYNDYYLYPYNPGSGFIRSNSFYSDFDFMTHNSDLLYENDQFYPDLAFFVDTIPMNNSFDDLQIDEEIKTGMRKDTVGPQFYVNLDTSFFRTKFFDKAGQVQLTDNTIFQTYFRGLYVHATTTGSAAAMMLFSPKNVSLVLAYRYSFINKNGTPNDPSDDYIDHGYEKIMLMGKMSINVYRNHFYPGVEQAITTANPQTGEEKVYLKGNAGSMGVLTLFDPPELYQLRTNNWIINQANLRFYVDENEMNDVPESQHPKRIYVYKYNSQIPISDLSNELESGQKVDINQVLDVYDGTLHSDSVSGQKYYEVNVTRTVKEILRKDSANVRLGVRIIQDLESFLVNRLLLEDPDAYIPFGTVLKGNLAADHPVELQIYYTEPEADQ